MREFNITGLCIPSKHYMADISNKVSQIAAMVEKGQYFTINRARQYGKTTTIRQLLRELTVGNRAYSHNIDNQAIQFASIFGIVEKRGIFVAIHNRIFEVRITNYFASEKELQDSKFVGKRILDVMVGV